MEKITSAKIAFSAFVGAAGGAIAQLFGGWNEDVVTLLLFMAVDYITGLIVAGVFKNSAKTESGALNSYAGFKGLCKKCAILLMVLIAHRLDITLGLACIRAAVIVAFIANELISIIENVGAMGVTVPEPISKAIDLLKDKGDNKNDNNGSRGA